MARNGGVVPAYRSTIEATAFQTEFKKDAEMWPFFELLPNFQPFPSSPAYAKVEAIVDAQLQAIWAGATSPREGLREAQRQVQPLLDEAQK